MSSVTDFTKTAADIQPGHYVGDDRTYDQIHVGHVTRSSDGRRVTFVGRLRSNGQAATRTWPADSRVTLTYTEVAMTAQQTNVKEQAEELLRILDNVVPSSTAHYAVEDARRTLRTLARLAHTIKTNDA
jgi:hypothetical protein